MAMRIVFIAPGSGPLVLEEEKNKPVGGAEIQMYLLARELAKSKINEVSLVVSGEEKDFTLGKLKIVVMDNWSVWGGVFNRLWQLRPEIVIQRAAGMLTFWSWFWARLKGAKFVYMVAHDMDVSTAKNNFLARNWWWVFFRFAVVHSDLVVVQNKLQAGCLSTFYDRSVVLMENGVPLDLIEKELVKHSPEGVIAVTRLVKFKRPELYLKLASEISPVKVTVLAYPTGDKELIDKYRKAEETLNNFVWIKGVSWEDTWKVISDYAVFVNTSLNEGFPNVFLQASALGIPVVSLAVDPNGYLNKSGGGWVEKGNWVSFSDKIKFLLEHEGERKLMGCKGQVYIKKHNSTSGLVRNILEKALNGLYEAH